ncbi:MAG: hypothetical protein ACQET8_17360 [Bacillota bacterium]
MDRKDSKNLESIAKSLAGIDKSLKVIASSMNPEQEEHKPLPTAEEIYNGKPFRKG